MGNCASKEAKVVPHPQAAPAAAPLPRAPLKDWSETDVHDWMMTLPDNIRSQALSLLPASGKLVAEWTEEDLADAGLKRYAAKQLMEQRNKHIGEPATGAISPSGPAQPSQGPEMPQLDGPRAGALPPLGHPRHRQGLHPLPRLEVQTPLAAANGSSASKPEGTPERLIFGLKVQKVLELARKALPAAQMFLSKLSEVAPFPGDVVCGSLSVLLGLVDTCLANKDHMRDLAECCAELFDLIIESKGELIKGDRVGDAYKRIMSRFRELLQEIQELAVVFSGRNAFVKVFKATGDQAYLRELHDKLRDLRSDATLAKAVETHGTVVEVRLLTKQVDAKVSMLVSMVAPHARDRERVKEAVTRLGGEQTILSDPDKMQQLTRELDIENQMVLSALMTLQANQDKGPHLHIKQPDLRAFWQFNFRGRIVAKFADFWELFPEEIGKSSPHLSTDTVSALVYLLKDDGAKDMFQRAVQAKQAGKISVKGLQAFPEEADLLDGIKIVVGYVSEASDPDRHTEGKTADPFEKLTKTMPIHWAMHRSCYEARMSPLAVGPAVTGALPFELADLGPNYVPRSNGSAARLAGLLAVPGVTGGSGGMVRCLSLVGSGGLGKTSTALEIGHNLCGILLGGAVLVDLRDALRAVDIDGRFCAAMGVNKGSDARAALLTRARALPAAAASLLVVDNAEDILLGQEPQALPELLSEVLAAAPALSVVVTSRVDLPPLPQKKSAVAESVSSCSHNERLETLSDDVAAQLVRSVAGDKALSDLGSGVDAVVAACGGNPLLLRVVTDAVVCGRMSLEQVSSLSTASSTQSGVEATVSLTIKALEDRRLVQGLACLSTFPSGFDSEGAAAVMGCDETRASALVGTLVNKGLVQYDSQTSRHFLHTAVRTAAREVAPSDELGAAEGRYMSYVLGLVHPWADLFVQEEGSTLALDEARSHEADTSALLRLLAREDLGAEAAAEAAMKLTGSSETDTSGLLDAVGLLHSEQSLDVANNLVAALSRAPDSSPAGNKDTVAELASARLLASNHLRRQGKTSDAIGQAEASLKSLESTFGRDDWRTLTAVSSLASCLHEQGHFGDALPLYQRALEARERTLGPEHPDTLTSVNDLANCLDALGRTEEALPLHQRALQARERTLASKDYGKLVSMVAPHARDRERVLEAVRKLGGEEEILKDLGKMQQLTSELGIENKLVLSALASLQASQEEGPHRHIKQPDLRAFWLAHFRGRVMAPFQEFWLLFPEALGESSPHLSTDTVLALVDLLKDREAKKAFQMAVQAKDAQSISVKGLKDAFPDEGDLLEGVKKVVGYVADASDPDRQTERKTAGPAEVTNAASNRQATGSNPDEASTSPLAAGPAATGALPFELPALDPSYVSRSGGCVDPLAGLLAVPGVAGGSGGGTVRCLCLVGSGGLGKSSFALEIGHNLRGRLTGGAVLVDLRDARMAVDVHGRFCTAMGVDKGSDGHAALLTRARALPAAVPALLVVDNAEDTLQGKEPQALPELLSTLLAAAPALSVLVTSRSELPPLPHNVSSRNERLEALSDDMAVQLVRAVAGDKSALSGFGSGVNLVVAACWGNPLLLRVVTNAVVCGRMSLQEVDSLSTSSSTQSVVEAMVSLTIKALEDHRLVQGLACLSTFPSGWDSEGAAAVMGCDETRARALVRTLYRHGLVQYDSQTSRHFLHMAVQSAARTMAPAGELSVAEGRYVSYVLELLQQWADLFMQRDGSSLALAEARSHEADTLALLRLLAREGLGAEAAAEAAMKLTWSRDTNTCGLLAALGLLHSGQSLDTALNLVAALSCVSDSSPAGSRDVELASARLLASYHLRLQGKYSDAQEQAAASAEALERTLGGEDWRTLTVDNELAGCLQALGRSQEALPLYQRALEARERILGPEHPDTLASVNDLAGCLGCLGRSQEALPLYERALKDRERTLGPEHPDTLALVNNLANCLSDLGRSQEALPLYERALEARERILGPEHPDTLASVNNLAGCLQALGRFQEALPLYKRDLESSERTLGSLHPDTLISVNNLAGCLQALGRSQEALPLYERALEASERTLGPEHPDTLISVNNLAGCLQALGRFQEALPLYERDQEASERTMGPEHPDTLASVNNLANCLRALGRSQEALPLYERVLEARERTFGPEHPNTLISVDALAICKRELGLDA